MLISKNHYLKIFFVAIFFASSFEAYASLDVFIKAINDEFQEIKNYSKDQFIPHANFSDQLDESIEIQKILGLGHKLLFSLIDQENNYKNLEFQEWVEATEYLFYLDQYVSHNTAYGNLVIKCQIIEMILSEMVRRLGKEENDIDVINQLIERLRYHLPDKVASMQVALEYYGQSEILPRNMNASETLDTDFKTFISENKEMISQYEYGKKDTKVLSELNKHKNTSSLMGFYGKPAPFLMALMVDNYAKAWWRLKIKGQILKDKGLEFSDWPSLDNDVYFRNLLKKEPWKLFSGMEFVLKNHYDLYYYREQIRLINSKRFRVRFSDP